MKPAFKPPAFAFALSLVLFFASPNETAFASQLSISPVRVTLSGERFTAPIRIRNNGEKPVVLQAHVVSWSHDGTRHVYEATNAMIAGPPLFRLAPKAEQTVRVGLRRPITSLAEQPFRLFLQEVPQRDQSQRTGLRVALRFSIPIFVLPSQPVAPRLLWSAHRGADGVSLTVRNEGDGHVQISEIRLRATAGHEASFAMSVYVLPAQRHHWTLPLDWPDSSAALELTAVTNAGITREVLYESGSRETAPMRR